MTAPTATTAMPTIERRNHGKGHSYRINGTKVPGVTTIIGETTSKPALINWAGDTTANWAVDHWDDLAELTPTKKLAQLKAARFADRDAAANRGTEVHRLAEAYINGLEISVPDELEGHVRAYEKFAREWDVKPVHVEVVIGNTTLGYCGTVDLIADMADGHRHLTDLKTSRSGIFPETALQVVAYSKAEFYAIRGPDGKYETHPMEELNIQRLSAVHVQADDYRVIPIQQADEVWEYFRHLAWLYRRLETQAEWLGNEQRIPESTTAVPA
jgi:hypothetical protein